MKRLDSYSVLVNDVFYRGMHILDYLYSKENISTLDIEAIKNTILTALVEKGEIDQYHEFLDLRKMVITDVFYFGCDCYNPKPFVQGIPLWMKEQLRDKSLRITGGLPVSVHATRPTSWEGYCVYDANTAFSILFDDFTFLIADYDSPTRPGKKATDRPFLEAEVDGTSYLFDLLTKRMFETEEFTRRYKMIVKERVQKSKFDERQTALYAEQTSIDKRSYGTFLSLCLPMIEGCRDVPKMQEYIYEIDESKEFFPRAFEEVEEIKEDMKRFGII